MAKNPTLKRLTDLLTWARTQHDAGDVVRARLLLQQFKAGAPAVHTDQQQAMVRELTYHLKQREELAVLTRGALALSKEVSKGVSGEAPK
jgi:hypothetical protein